MIAVSERLEAVNCRDQREHGRTKQSLGGVVSTHFCIKKRGRNGGKTHHSHPGIHLAACPLWRLEGRRPRSGIGDVFAGWKYQSGSPVAGRRRSVLKLES